MTPLIPVPKPSAAATLRQWLDWGALVDTVRLLGGWHEDESRHLVLLYQREYPSDPADLRQAEQYAKQVRAAIQAARAGR